VQGAQLHMQCSEMCCSSAEMARHCMGCLPCPALPCPDLSVACSERGMLRFCFASTWFIVLRLVTHPRSGGVALCKSCKTPWWATAPQPSAARSWSGPRSSHLPSPLKPMHHLPPDLRGPGAAAADLGRNGEGRWCPAARSFGCSAWVNGHTGLGQVRAMVVFSIGLVCSIGLSQVRSMAKLDLAKCVQWLCASACVHAHLHEYLQRVCICVYVQICSCVFLCRRVCVSVHVCVHVGVQLCL